MEPDGRSVYTTKISVQVLYKRWWEECKVLKHCVVVWSGLWFRTTPARSVRTECHSSWHSECKVTAKWNTYLNYTSLAMKLLGTTTPTPITAVSQRSCCSETPYGRWDGYKRVCLIRCISWRQPSVNIGLSNLFSCIKTLPLQRDFIFFRTKAIFLVFRLQIRKHQ
jgi:hypothetical protein